MQDRAYMNDIFKTDTDWETLSSHVNVTSIPPHAGMLSVDVNFSVDGSHDMTASYAPFRFTYTGFQEVWYRLGVDSNNTGFTSPAGTLEQFDTKDYYSVLGPA